MNYLSLFTGIGGIDLGLDRAGMTCVGQVEIDPFCRRVLAKHWPEVPRHDDVRTTVDWWLGTTRPAVDLVCGGFPCQPFSTAGRRQGVTDERWGWPWFWNVVSALRPRYVLVENVAALLRDADAFAWLLGDLAAGGYDADWDCVPAAAVGAPHRRDRLFLVAHARSPVVRDEPVPVSGGGRTSVAGDDGANGHVADADGTAGRPAARDAATGAGGRALRLRPAQPRGRGDALADATSAERRAAQSPRVEPPIWRAAEPGERGSGGGSVGDWWRTEPNVGRVAHGIPARVDRLRALGNAVVPQVAEHVGRLILTHAQAGVS